MNRVFCPNNKSYKTVNYSKRSVRFKKKDNIKFDVFTLYFSKKNCKNFIVIAG